MVSFKVIFMLHNAIFIPVTLSQQGIPTDTFPYRRESPTLLETDYKHVHSLMNPYPNLPLERSISDIEKNSTDHVVKPPVPAQQDPSLVLNSSNCFVGNIIQGVGYDSNRNETGRYIIPPDPSGAAGIDRLVSVVNTLIEVRSKNGTLIFLDGLADFFISLDTQFSNSSRVFDPKVIYDEHEGRFVVVTLQRADSLNVSRILIAVSKNEQPDTASAWNFLAIDSSVSIGGNLSWADYPGFEVDEAAVYITANMFSFASYTFTGVRLWILDKGVIGGFYDGGTSPTILGPYNPDTEFELSYTSMPAQVHGSGGVVGSTGTFLVSSYQANSRDLILQVVTVMNPLTSPTFPVTYINLGKITQFFIPSAPQLGTSKLIETSDISILDAVWRANKLWVTMTINPPTGTTDVDQATAHWVRLDTTNGIITLDEQGNLGGESFSGGTHTYYPAVAINKQGHAAFGYSASSPTLYAGAYGSILIGSTLYSFTVQGGTDSYVRTFGGTRNRWGDYTGISVDPSDDSFWIFNQFADSRGQIDTSFEDGRWGTVWAQVYCTVPPTAAPTPTDLSCGLFGLSIFCPLTWCGTFGRLLGLCKLE